MLRYTSQSLLKWSWRNLLLILGLLALSSGLSTYVSANQSAGVKVAATLNENWRGVYDILVRHPSSIQATERDHGLVEANYLSVGKSGISVAQWKQIEQLANVEVAAPAATIGYLRNATGSIVINVPPQQQTALYRASVTISSTNGYKLNEVSNQNQYYLLNPPTSAASSYVLLSTVNGGAGGAGDLPFLASIQPLPVLWTLVTGVDPQAERKLSSLDQAIVQDSYLGDNDGYTLETVLDPLDQQGWWGHQALARVRC